MGRLKAIKETDLGFKYIDGVEDIWLTGGYTVLPIFTIKDRCVKPWEANVNEEWRKLIVTSIAAISRGKSNSKNPSKRYSMLLKEAVNNPKKIDVDNIKLVAGRPLEFVPVVLRYMYKDNRVWLLPLTLDKNKDIVEQIIHSFSIEDFNNDILDFGYTSERDFPTSTYILKTNLRTLINAGVPYENIPYMQEGEEKYYKDFKVAVIQAPHFVFDQLYTHTVFSKIAVSERVTREDHYYLPDDLLDRIEDVRKNWQDYEIEMDYIVSVIGDKIHSYKENKTYGRAEKRELLEEIIDSFLSEFTHQEVIDYFQDFGYKQEIYNRWSYGMKYKTFIMGGWENDPKVWNHLLVEREAYPEYYKSWVQAETSKIAKSLRKLIKA